MLPRVDDRRLMAEVQDFLYREARLQDEHKYEAWEALWTDEAVYWVPANGSDIDPETEMSIIYDNRSRIALRVRQLLTGRHFTQAPQSRLARIVSNIELLEDGGNEIHVASNCLIYESNLRGQTVWASRNEHRLSRIDGELRMAFKKVVLVNNDQALHTMSFLV